VGADLIRANAKANESVPKHIKDPIKALEKPEEINGR
jgi:hypothetical protein